MTLTFFAEGPLDGSDGTESASHVVGVAPSVLVAVVFGVLATVVLLFSLALLMDRWNRYVVKHAVRASQISNPSSTSTVRT